MGTSKKLAEAINQPLVIQVQTLNHRYRGAVALRNISLDVAEGSMVGLIGADGVGKSTLLGIIAGVRKIQEGTASVLGGDMRAAGHRAAVCSRIAYMPQGLGQNLYSELSVSENIEFFGRLFNVPAANLHRQMTDLLAATGLTSFVDRQVGKLSGGMKQKLGLCCALIHQPDLLILDEPTTGIDPLSRLQFWELVAALRRQTTHLTVLVATSYMNEAERFDRLVLMDAGGILAGGSPAELKAQTHTATLDEAYIGLLPPERRRGHEGFSSRSRTHAADGPTVEARALTRRFGDFTAVDNVTFSIARGEIFGFVGPNGCGKTTTLKMVTGLLPVSQGEVRLFGRPIAIGSRELRRRLGYMSQSFSLYAELSVRQNLELHARLFDVLETEMASRVNALVERFGLENVVEERAEELPVGIRQRLSLAVASIHRPAILILDEPTSGVDPVARDVFWLLLLELSRDEGTTIFVSTHYLAEAARCDRVALMNAGRVLACAAPEVLIQERAGTTLEEAFISYIREDQERTGEGKLALGRLRRDARPSVVRVASATLEGLTSRVVDLRRLWALVNRETLQIWRDPFRMFSAFLVPLMLMLIFGFGLNMDIERLPYAALDYDRTPQSRTYLEHFAASRYFDQQARATSDTEIERRFQSGEIRLAVEIPAGFGRELKRGRSPEVGIWIDGTFPYRAETSHGYAEQLHSTYLQDLARRTGSATHDLSPVKLETRYWFNQGLKSKYAFVPALIAVVLILTPSMLTAVAVVREKELGSITNLYATPVTRLEFLWGKQIPYAGISFLNFLILTGLVVVVFQVPLGGSFLALTLGALAYVFASTGIGLLVSTFTRTQVAGVLVTMILTMVPSFQYSGLLSPVSALEGGSYIFGRLFPTMYFLNISVGAFTKDLHVSDLLPNYLALLAFCAALTTISVLLLKKQQA